ncbi:flagellar basal body-associated protein FliL [Azospirillum lipoferum]|uniref:Flagellar protein FliL n=1 Tax=Azospirillum lipoferum TaxID=193 RepID=A0A5A9GWH9_AZOLI|nr:MULTISPECIES: flagellar basal body-associated FliL family protein [Azospirillum]KAA0598055.1 flagellar basal body-associated FliL family protein [Azospirillum lipoferum]MCP1613833.1 flagellar basal body-associated protein FliL [Azospirillum lipoferum]MDW5534715.1 flagellar basal body-associated FliL family protein [Azospirillum sp. NL1]
MATHRTLHGNLFSTPPHDPLRDELAHHHETQPEPAHPTRLLIVVLIALFTLAGLAYGGGIAVDRILEQRRIETRMGPKPRLAQLPAIEVPLGASRAVEMQVSLVLAPKVEPDRILRYQDRIADRLFQTVSRVDSETLTGPGSADFLKARIKEAVNREAGTGLFRDIYIERMVVK